MTDDAPHSPTTPRAGALARLWPLALIATAAALIVANGWHQHLSLDALRENRAALQGFVATQLPLAVGAFVLVYVLFTLTMMPGALWLTIGGGFLFGLVGGAALTVAAATLGATALFVAARTSVGAPLRRRAGPFLKKLEAGFQENAFSYMLSMRFLPVVPWPVANIAPALLGAKTRDFVLTTAIGVVPGVIAYAWVGSGLGAVFDRGESLDLAGVAQTLTPPLAALGLLSLAPALVRRLRRGKQA